MLFALVAVVLCDPTLFINLAKDAMLSGNFQTALLNYDKAIELDPFNHVTFYRRAAAYLTIGKNELAIKDFDVVLELKQDNNPARLKRAELLLMQGHVDQSLTDFDFYLSSQPTDQSAIEKASNAREAKELMHRFDSITKNCLIEDITSLLRLCPKRANCHLERKETELAIGDYSRVLKLHGNQNEISLLLAKLYSNIGELDGSISAIKECLRQDPDHPECKTHFRYIKKIQKAFIKLEDLARQKKWLTVSEELETFLPQVEELGANNLKAKALFLACSAYSGMKKFEQAITFCTRGLDLDENNIEARILRGEAYLTVDKFAEAKRDFKTAHDADNQNQRIIDGYKKAEALLKRAGMRDYYKTLGVDRTASAREIKKAFRRMAQQYHPDKYRGDMDKEAVLKKMSEINQANEVLSNEELRTRYDQGDDPNDPNQQGAQNPFQGGGGFHFQGFQGQGFPGNQFNFQF